MELDDCIGRTVPVVNESPESNELFRRGATRGSAAGGGIRSWALASSGDDEEDDVDAVDPRGFGVVDAFRE